MAVRILGANHKSYTEERILQAAMDKRIKDAKRGLPLRIVTLDWNMRKKQYPMAKTKGAWDDVFITRRPSGGLELQYKHPGALEWIKDGLTAEYSALCAVTPGNLFLLASHYYDNLWTIRDEEIDRQVKAMADEIDEENKKKPFTFLKTYKEIDEKTGVYKCKEETVTGTMYEFHKQRREGHFKDHNEKLSIAPMNVAERANIDNERAEIERQRKELEARERKILEKEKASGIIENVIPPEQVTATGGVLPVYSEEELNTLHIAKLRKLARDEFKITTAFSMRKAEIVPEIIKIIAQNGDDDIDSTEIPLDDDFSETPLTAKEQIVEDLETVVN